MFPLRTRIAATILAPLWMQLKANGPLLDETRSHSRDLGMMTEMRPRVVVRRA
jgi:hypothetical protein